MLYRIVSYIALHCIVYIILLLCYAMLCYVILSYVVSCRVMSCYVTSRHVTSRHVMSCHVMSCHIILYYIMLLYLLYYIVLCCVMLCYSIHYLFILLYQWKNKYISIVFFLLSFSLTYLNHQTKQILNTSGEDTNKMSTMSSYKKNKKQKQK